MDGAKWLRQMPSSTRSVAIELHENASVIEAWRNTLPERQRRRLIHPLSVTRRWKASREHGNGKCPQNLNRDAIAAWRRFLICVKSLPKDQAAPLWQMAQSEAAALLKALELEGAGHGSSPPSGNSCSLNSISSLR
jgi:hypothetical protein